MCSYFDKLPDPGQDKNTVDFTCKNPKGNGENDQEEDKSLHDLTQEFEFQEESGPPIHKKN